MENKLPVLLFIFGVILLMMAFLTGEAKGGIFIIFPFIFGSGIYSLVGMLLIFVSFILFFLSFPKEHYDMKIEEKKGGIVFIGPIPIIFSSDFKMVSILLLIAFIFLIIFIALFFYALTIAK